MKALWEIVSELSSIGSSDVKMVTADSEEKKQVPVTANKVVDIFAGMIAILGMKVNHGTNRIVNNHSYCRA